MDRQVKQRNPHRARMSAGARRRAIVTAAWEVFQDEGFERASMSAIAKRAGGSKATLYVYFKSKEALFAAALEEAQPTCTGQAFAGMRQTGELRSRLVDFGSAYLEIRLSADLIKMDRAVIGAAGKSHLGAGLRHRLIEPQLRQLATIMTREMERGGLREGDPYTVALHFRGLVEADLLERRLHGDRSLARSHIRRVVMSGVDAFLRAYAA